MSGAGSEDILIVGAARTPIGGLLGELSGLTAPQLGSAAVRAAVARARIDPGRIDEVLLGNCLLAGLGQAPARQAALGAGLPLSAGAVTLSKMCGSGMRAIQFGHDMLRAGSADAIVAGGMESMSNAPYLVPRARQGYRYGHATIYDHMALDGLEDAYERGRPMGSFAEDCAAQFGFTREEQDEFAIRSTERAQRATAGGAFAWEIEPVEIPARGGAARVERDEQPARARLDKVRTLRPVFREGGTVTAANSSSISDGAAAVVLLRASTAREWGCAPVARILAHAIHAQEPALFTTAPAGAIRRVLARAGWTVRDVDLWEINEAFAVVTMAAMREFELPAERVNVHGGACALGHPIGCSGARILVTLLGALRQRGLRRGVAALCIGGGEASALAVELEG